MDEMVARLDDARDDLPTDCRARKSQPFSMHFRAFLLRVLFSSSSLQLKKQRRTSRRALTALLACAANNLRALTLLA